MQELISRRNFLNVFLSLIPIFHFLSVSLFLIHCIFFSLSRRCLRIFILMSYYVHTMRWVESKQRHNTDTPPESMQLQGTKKTYEKGPWLGVGLAGGLARVGEIPNNRYLKRILVAHAPPPFLSFPWSPFLFSQRFWLSLVMVAHEARIIA